MLIKRKEKFKLFKREMDENDDSLYFINEKEVNLDTYIKEQDSFRLSSIQILRQDSKIF